MGEKCKPLPLQRSFLLPVCEQRYALSTRSPQSLDLFVLRLLLVSHLIINSLNRSPDSTFFAHILRVRSINDSLNQIYGQTYNKFRFRGETLIWSVLRSHYLAIIYAEVTTIELKLIAIAFMSSWFTTDWVLQWTDLIDVHQVLTNTAVQLYFSKISCC